MTDLLDAIGHWFEVWAPILGRAAVEVFIIFLFVYAFMLIMEGSRGAGILKGLALFAALLAGTTIFVTRRFQLDNLNWVITMLAPVIVIPLFVLFQPEVRRALIRLGQNPLFRVFFRPHRGFTEELVKATFSLARDKVGGLIAIEREVGLRGYVEGGIRLDAEVSAELIKTIFWPGTPLHDGAIVIRQQRVAAAGCLFPLTDSPQFSSDLGTRHRAGIGVTEESDAAAIIISEQTGQVSLAVGGTLQRDMEERSLRRALEELAAEPSQPE
ncbi:MAG: diadenylate cyclase CdaA [Planctomycetota bacterium]|jgi:diadenylate cyclase